MATTGHPTADFPEFMSLKRFSTADYLQMIEAGVLENGRVELIGGMIVDMSPAGSRHNHFLGRLNRLFARIWDKGEVWVQGTLQVAEGQVYDPDFLLLRPKLGGYKQQLPTAQDVLLVVEAAEYSLPTDQQVKLPVYAIAGISEYWIADLDRESLIVYREPEGPLYRSVQTFHGNDLVFPLVAPEFSFAVREAFE